MGNEQPALSASERRALELLRQPDRPSIEAVAAAHGMSADRLCKLARAHNVPTARLRQPLHPGWRPPMALDRHGCATCGKPIRLEHRRCAECLAPAAAAGLSRSARAMARRRDAKRRGG